MPTPESYVTPAIKALFKPQFATQDPDIYATLLKTWQDFADGHIRWPKGTPEPTEAPAVVSYACNYILLDLRSQPLPAGLSFVFATAWAVSELWVRVAEITPFQTSIELVGSLNGQGLILKYAVVPQAPRQLRSLPGHGWNGIDREAGGRQPLVFNAWEAPTHPPMARQDAPPDLLVAADEALLDASGVPLELYRADPSDRTRQGDPGTPPDLT